MELGADIFTGWQSADYENLLHSPSRHDTINPLDAIVQSEPKCMISGSTVLSNILPKETANYDKLNLHTD